MLHVEQRDNGHVVLCTIDRPKKRNAVDHATLNAIGDAIDDAVATRARVLVLTGSGGSFSAGADLGGVEGDEFLGALRRALTGLAEAPIVTIAAVDGHALGAGVQLSGFADLRVATPTSTFGVPAAKLGIAVDQATVARVVELCGGGAARAMLLAAATFDGMTAHQLGFVSKLGDLEVALAWASEIAALAPLTIAAHKQALSAIRAHTNSPADPRVRAAFERAWASTDLQEGRTAFLERRAPRFTGN